MSISKLTELSPAVVPTILIPPVIILGFDKKVKPLGSVSVKSISFNVVPNALCSVNVYVNISPGLISGAAALERPKEYAQDVPSFTHTACPVPIVVITPVVVLISTRDS